MSRIVAAFNMTLDGNCDHLAGIPDQEVHDHYTVLLERSDLILYGRKTFELMEFWRGILENPSEDQSMNDFATAIDKIDKLVFSRTLKSSDWESARITDQDPVKLVKMLRNEEGTDILIGSKSLIIQLLDQGLIDEFQLCIYPVVAGKGLQLFENLNNRAIFRLEKTKTFNGGAVLLYYQPINKQK